MTAFIFVAIAVGFAYADRALIVRQTKGSNHEATHHSDRASRLRTRRGTHRGRRRWLGTTVVAHNWGGTRFGNEDDRVLLPETDEVVRHALLGWSCPDCPHPMEDRRAS